MESQSTVAKKLAQNNCIETSRSCIIFQYFKNLCKTRQNIEESVVLFAKILAFTVYPEVLPFLIRKRGTPCPRNRSLSGPTNKSMRGHHVSNSARDFDPAMWRTWVDQFANYWLMTCLTHRQRKKLKDL